MNNVFKKILLILSIFLIALTAVEAVMMFVPYMELKPIPNKRDEVTVLTKYSLQEYCWTSTEEINEVFIERDRDAEMERVNAIIESGQFEANRAELEKTYDEQAIQKMEKGRNVGKKDVERALMVGINDGLVDLALINVFNLLAGIMLVMEIKHLLSKYRLATRGAWTVLSHLFVIVWGAFSLSVFLGTPLLDEGYNTIVRTICTYNAIGALAVEAVRLVFAFLTRTRYKKVKAVY